MNPVGIYIHVPFCAKKCPYCDFYSCPYSLTAAEQYTDAIIRDIKNLPENIYADTIYFGGGTPSILPVDRLNKILDALYHHCRIINPEITLEINPCTVTEEKLFQYSNIGINRLSIGVQSVHDDELKLLGRIHSWKKAKEIIKSAQIIGFDNISCDVIIGLPEQNIDKIKTTLNKIAELSVQHISAYILKIEENTPFNTPDVINT
ncbi:MAG: coproporphyrinogen III oxidase family protein, partial [Oscillospiraceae bacterium]|nr:coproporphyrinogen III oxidase family protein [Oscillospiraceae bacterium]